jgi:uncharacterized membrane protein
MYYVNYFFFYSIIGHLIETIVYAFHRGESGILFCPWTPIYGFGVIIVLLCFNIFIKKYKSWKVRIPLLFFIGFFFLSLLEFIGGILIEKIFRIIFWSYENLKYNIGNYISLEISLCWGISSILIILLTPITDKIIKKIPRSISWLLILLMILDVIITIMFK